jgi:hypothetical protein
LAKRSLRVALVVCSFVTLIGGCERRPRARERELAETQARARTQAEAERRRALLPPPLEPPLETVRVAGSGLPCQVDDVFADKCRRCHGVPPRHGAPLVFMTWEDTRQDRLGEPLYTVLGRAVRSGFMPYKIDANPPILPLTPEEKRIILDWVEAGAPRQDCQRVQP